MSNPVAKIFISYRRDDSAPWAGRLYDRIEAEFDPEHIFMDIDMEPGLDFVEEIEQAVSSCDVLIAVIGPRWLTMADGAGRRRLDAEQDWVRLEVATALRRQIRVIPCLVDKARMPKGSELPEDLALLARRQAVTLTHERFRADAQRLTRAIAKILDAKSLAPQPRVPQTAHPVTARPRVAPKVAGQTMSGPNGLEYVWVPPGVFQMGAVPGDESAGDDEKPRHRVEITRGFWIGRTPVTVAAYKRFASATGREMPAAPGFDSQWAKEDHPMVNVTWHDADAYCKSAGGRLPTEAEWEYAARGGKEGLIYPHGNELTRQDAKYGTKDGTAPVGRFPANGFGAHDMAGNVWEWCADWFGEDYYGSSPPRDPPGPPSGQVRVLRGGSWDLNPWILRVSYRLRNLPDDRVVNVGFRCVREVSP